MAQQKALFLQTPVNGEWHVGLKAVPKPDPGELVVKIHATALNPVDWKICAFNFLITEYPATLGLDSTGTVEAVGEGVQGFAKGDRVLHSGFFSNDKSTYQQYTLVPAEISAKLPSNISFDEGASVPTGLGTAAIGLYGDRPSGFLESTPAWKTSGKGLYRGQPIVIIGGSSSVGQYVIQLAKLSGFSPIITIASVHNTVHLESLGVTHVVDRNASDVSAKIAKILSGSSVKIVFDAVLQKETRTQGWDLLAPGGALVLLLAPQIDREKYKDKTIVSVQGSVNAPHARALDVSLYSKVTALLGDGSIKPNHVEALPGGLAGIPDGLECLKSGNVSGKKLIARPQETVWLVAILARSFSRVKRSK